MASFGFKVLQHNPYGLVLLAELKLVLGCSAFGFYAAHKLVLKPNKP
jgi:hypothetical protein